LPPRPDLRAAIHATASQRVNIVARSLTTLEDGHPAADVIDSAVATA
jgi:hypothetical protein